jgi:hypothetical protein
VLLRKAEALITREEVRLIFLWLMQIDAKLDEILEEDDGQEEADRS